MVLEHAILDVRPGMADDFAADFAVAKSIIAAMPGFGSLTLSRCVEAPDRFLLLVQWDTLDDHTVGFRTSPEYQRWKALLHHYYEPFPEVAHFELVTGI